MATTNVSSAPGRNRKLSTTVSTIAMTLLGSSEPENQGGGNGPNSGGGCLAESGANSNRKRSGGRKDVVRFESTETHYIGDNEEMKAKITDEIRK